MLPINLRVSLTLVKVTSGPTKINLQSSAAYRMFLFILFHFLHPLELAKWLVPALEVTVAPSQLSRVLHVAEDIEKGQASASVSHLLKGTVSQACRFLFQHPGLLPVKGAQHGLCQLGQVALTELKTFFTPVEARRLSKNSREQTCLTSSGAPDSAFRSVSAQHSVLS